MTVRTTTTKIKKIKAATEKKARKKDTIMHAQN